MARDRVETGRREPIAHGAMPRHPPASDGVIQPPPCRRRAASLVAGDARGRRKVTIHRQRPRAFVRRLLQQVTKLAHLRAAH
eukprot:1462405-Prymnesium_polylepis.2